VNLFISPHNDDEALFGAYTCLEHRPFVLVVLRSFVEATWPDGPGFAQRELETAASCAVLGCEHDQWTHEDSAPDWGLIRRNLTTLRPERVWAPLPEEGGHPHHNAIGEMALDLWPQTVFYATYTHKHGKTTTGELVQPRAGWVAIKRAAMDCYESQATHPYTQAAFNEWPIDEYLTTP
jgi:LmbE family N-acetylglucosaminyl deacetylase